MAKAATSVKVASKTEVLNALAEKSDLSRKEVGSVLDALGEMIGKELGKRGPGVFSLPGLVKIKVVRKPATPERTMPNPFKPGEMMTVKAKAARNVVKAIPLKKLKDMA